MSTQKYVEVIPLLRFLGKREDDGGLNDYLSSFGKKPKLFITEYSASLSYKKHGFSLAFNDEEWAVEDGMPFTKGVWILCSFFLYSNGHDGFRQYSGPLIERLSFADDRKAVAKKLGQPHLQGGGNKGPGSIVWPKWDRFDYEDVAVNVSYTEGEKSIGVITFMTLFEANRIRPKSVQSAGN